MGKIADNVELLKTLSNPVNLELLVYLSGGPSYPRELARLMGRSESDIARRLRRLERLGLVESSWTRISDRTIRLYRSLVKDVKLDLTGGKIFLKYHSGGEVDIPTVNCNPSPSVPKHFVGRAKELAMLRKSEGLVYVWGPPGIGKSSLVAAAFKDNTVWYSLSEWDGLSLLARRLACYLALQGSSELLLYLRNENLNGARLAEEVRPLLSKHKTTLVIDDFHKSGDGVKWFVTNLAKDARGFRLIIISRTPPKKRFATSGLILRVDPLNEEETSELVRLLGGRVRGAYKATQGHPLLIELYSRFKGADYWDQAIDYIMEECLIKMPEKDREVFYILASLPDDVTEEFLAELVGRGVRLNLYRLLNMGLVYRKGGYYGVPGFIKSVLVEWPQRRDILYKVAERLSKSPGWLKRLRAMNYAILAGDPLIPARIIRWRIKSDDHTYLFYVDEYYQVIRELLKLEIPWRLLPCIFLEKANLERQRADYVHALETCKQALNIASATGDAFCATRAVCLESYILARMGELGKAKRRARECEIKSLERGDYVGLYTAYSNLALIYSKLGDPDRAVDYARLEAKIASRVGDVVYPVMAWFHVGAALVEAGKPREALSWLEKARAASEVIGLKFPEAMTNALLGEAYAILGEKEKALLHIRRVQEMMTRLPRNLQEILNIYIIRVYNLFNMPGEAARLCDKANHQSSEAGLECSIAYAREGMINKAFNILNNVCKNMVPRIKLHLKEAKKRYWDVEWLLEKIEDECIEDLA